MTSRRTSVALAGTGLALVALVAACGGSSSSSVSADSAERSPDASRRAAVASPVTDSGSALTASVPSAARQPPSPAASDDQQQAVISTGNVQLRSPDVAAARADVQNIVDPVAGQIAQEQSDADDTGRLLRTHLVLRVPAKDFTTVMSRLGQVGDLVSTSQQARDVTTQVIDTDVRVRTQRASITRIRLLLSRATSIREIISIESELSSRQSDLDSLERQQAYLADQTSLATITVSIERTAPAKVDVAPAVHHHGFIAGLRSGWHGLSATTVGVLTAGGVVLPFAVVLLVLGVPAWLLYRRRRPTAAT